MSPFPIYKASLRLFIIFALSWTIGCGTVSVETPTPNVEKITVSFDTQGGNAIPAQTIEKGAKLTAIPSVPTKNNHTFNGWYTAATAGTVVNLDTKTFSTKTTLYARWTQTTFTITFDLNGEGATGKPDNQTVQRDNAATKPTVEPTRTDYNFVDWYQSQIPTQNESAFDFTSVITADLTLYARWTQGFTVTFDTQGGNNIPSQTVINGEKLATIPSTPTKDNHTFNGWYTAATAGTVVNLDTQTFSANTTLYAQWTQTTFTITFALNGEGATGKPDNQTVQNNTAAVKPPSNPVRTDYNFVGWYQSQTPSQNESAFDFTSLITADITLYAQWTQDFIVTFDTQGGVPTENQTVPQGGTATRPADNPTREHYTFENWYTTAETGGQVVAFPYTVTENITLYARWANVRFTITFNHNYGETPRTEAVMVNSGEKASKPNPDPTRDNYTFDNWYTTAETGGQVVTFPYTVTENITLYARWAQDFIVTFDTQGGTTIENQTVPQGGTATRPGDNPTRTDYNFVGWYQSQAPSQNESAFDFTSLITANITLYARWTQEIVVTFDTQGGTRIENQTVPQGGTATRPADNPTRDHYTFENWYTTAETGGQVVAFPYTVTENITLYARWANVRFTITFNHNYGETPSTDAVMVNSGKTASKPNPDPTRDNYTFDNWYTTAVTDGQVVTFPYTVTENITLYARWAQNFIVTFDTQGGTPIENQTVPQGRTATRPGDNPMRTDYNFVGWYQSQAPSQNESAFDFTTLVTADITLYARWTQEFVVTFDTQGGTTIENQVVPQGGTATRPGDNPTRDHYTFDNWYTTAVTGGQVVTFPFTVTENLTLYARWTRLQFTVTFNHNYGETPSTDAVMVNSGKTASKPDPDPTRDNYTFDNWYTTAVTDGQVVTFPYTVTENITLYARWTRLQFTVTFNHNYGETPSTGVVMVNSGETASKPDPDPTRDNYTFDNWYTTAVTGGQVVTFPYTVTENITLYARWTRLQFTVTFNHNYGETPGTEAVMVNSGETASKPDPDPNRDNYTFDNWYTTAETGGEVVTFPYTPTENVTLYARWIRIQLTITFNHNYGETPSTNAVMVNSGETAMPLAPEPTRADAFTFLGWFEGTSATALSETSFNFGVPPTQSLTLYAKWLQKTVVSFDTQGGTNVESQILATGVTMANKPPNPTKNRNVFINWFENAEGTGEAFVFTTAITASKTLYAKWKQTEFSVQFNTQGGSDVNSQTISPGRNAMKPNPNPMRENYIFNDWFENQQGTGRAFNFDTAIQEDKTLYAIWSRITFAITFDIGYTPTTGTPRTTEVLIDLQGKAYRGNPTRDKYTFNGWYTAQTGGEKIDLYTKQFDVPTTLFAQWTRINTYTITFNVGDGTSPTTNVMTNNDGKVTKTDPATRDKYTFIGWYTATRGGERRDLLTYVFTENTTLFARWELAIITFNNGYGFPASVVTELINTAGKIVGKVAPTRSPYTFSGWFTAKTGGELVDLTTKVFTAPTTLYAQWTLESSYTITFNDNNGTSSTGTIVRTNNQGKVTKIPPAPRAMYSFNGWYTARTGGERRDLSTYEFTEDTALFAQWVLIKISFDDGYGNPPTIIELQINEEGKIEGKAAPTRNLYTFNGWFIGQDQVSLATKVFTVPTTLYASWTRTKYVVILNYNDGVPPLTEPARIEVNPNDMLSTPTSPERTHYTLDSWHTSGSFTDTAFDFGNTPITADMSLYAKWTRATYTVTFNHNDGSTPLTTSTMTSNQLGFVGKPSTLTHANSNLKFLNWYAKENPTDTDTPFIFGTTLIVANMDLYALWTSQKIIVSFNTLEGSDVPSQALTAGEAATRPNLIPIKKHFVFVAWVTQEVNGDIYDFRTTLSADKTLYARWRHRPEDKEVLRAEMIRAAQLYGINVDLSYIDTSLITDLSGVYQVAPNFNGDISGWNVSNVINMKDLFFGSTNFNQDISKWDVSKVTDMSGMFNQTAFNQDISNWNVSRVTDMTNMFVDTVFNHDIGSWNVSSVENMAYMFYNAQFNHDIGNWNVSRVTNMRYMFSENSKFSQDISGWDINAVTIYDNFETNSILSADQLPRFR